MNAIAPDNGPFITDPETELGATDAPPPPPPQACNPRADRVSEPNVTADEFFSLADGLWPALFKLRDMTTLQDYLVHA